MRNRLKSAYSLALFLAACTFLVWAAAPSASEIPTDSWPYYGHDAGCVRYSESTQDARLIPREKYNDRSSRTEDGDYGDQLGAPYGLYRRFIQSPSDLPCSPPPWGTLTAVDMMEGKIRWQVPLGSMQDFGGAHPQQIPARSISLGGPIVTAGGLVFIAGTTDCFLRAFDIETGKELWQAQLPACGNATPMTYRVSATGKQYVVIAAGGHPKITEEKLGDSIVVFALPQELLREKS